MTNEHKRLTEDRNRTHDWNGVRGLLPTNFGDLM